MLLYDNLHGRLKFFILNHAVIILIHLVDDIVPDLLSVRGDEPASKDLLQLFLADCATFIFVDHLEGGPQVLTLQKHIFSEGCGQELGIINLAVPIDIHCLEHCPRVHLVLLEKGCHLLHTCFELIEGKHAVRVGIELDEHLTQLGKILRSGL